MISLILAASLLIGPVEADVVRVIDGDTYEVKAYPWLDTEIKTLVRVKGIDTPEKGSRAKCEAEKAKSIKATEYVTALFKSSKRVKLTNIEHDKYGGRVVADVSLSGLVIKDILIKEELARPYDGKAKSSWCK